MAHDAACSHSKALAKRTIPDKILSDRAYEIARKHKCDGHQRALPTMVYKFFNEKARSGMSVNKKEAEELRKPVTIQNKESLCDI